LKQSQQSRMSQRTRLFEKRKSKKRGKFILINPLFSLFISKRVPIKQLRKNPMMKPIFLNPFYQAKNTILVIGGGRSGTTWLSDLIDSSRGFLSIFEPFDTRFNPEAKIDYVRFYIPPDCENHFMDKAIEHAFLGTVRNSWTLKTNKNHLTWKILLKEVRLNLAIGYIKRKFQNKIVFIIRHPFSVITSRLKNGWGTHFNDFFGQRDLIEDYLKPYMPELKKAKTDLEKHAFIWTIENLIALEHLKNEDFCFVTYEDLISRKEFETQKIFSYLDITYPRNMQKRLFTPSQLTQKSNLDPKKLLTDWQGKLTRQEIEKILEIMSLFNFDLYNSEPEPNYKSRYYLAS
jgi:hypothetical protein